ncbi:MAG: helix-turn-helix transcriptional regulator [Rhodococcus sp.]|nr:helix-turn-helix transcriptional regulator [Rhodococcus sp. (in: high G+C Gram-positive bacteria)]
MLGQAMRESGVSQSELARLSGVHQPSISQFLSGRVELSDEQLNRLLACMGLQHEVVRTAVVPELTRAERRSWMLNRAVSLRLTAAVLGEWLPEIRSNLDRLRGGVTGEPHVQNLGRWRHLVETQDVAGLKRALTGLDRDSIEMREVSPFGGVLPDDERLRVLADSR